MGGSIIDELREPEPDAREGGSEQPVVDDSTVEELREVFPEPDSKGVGSGLLPFSDGGAECDSDSGGDDWGLLSYGFDVLGRIKAEAVSPRLPSGRSIL